MSSNDVLLAFLWMLKAEVSAKKRIATVADLNLHTITMAAPTECVMVGVPAVPHNYCGNAAFGTVNKVDAEDLEGKSFGEAYALLARMSRRGIAETKQQPRLQAEGLLSYYRSLNSAQFYHSMEEPAFYFSNLMKAPVGHIDFGERQPVLLHIALPLPLYGVIMMAGPGPRNDGGIIVSCPFLESELKVLERSFVVETYAPGMKRLHSDFSVDEMKAFLGMK